VDLSAGSLFLSLFTSAIGLALFTYGRKSARLPQVFGGVALMVYPYFVASAATSLVIGAMICVAVWVAVRMGY
jgi:hypothetical protein